MKSHFHWFCIYFLPGIFLLATGCKAQPPYQITGKIKGHTEWKPVVYLIQPRNLSEVASDYLGVVLDSATINEDGTFAFNPLAVEQNPVLLELVVQRTKSRFANHLLDSVPSESNYMPIIFTKGHSITITADAVDFQKTFAFINPSKANTILTSLRNIRLTAFKKFLGADSFQNENDSLLIEKEKAYQDFARELMNFADSTSCLEAAMLAIRWISPTGDYERMPEFIAGQCQKWSAINPEHPFTKQLCAIAQKNKLPLMTGDVMPDFTLPLVNGDTVSLSSLLGNKLTLLDLWASWCAPCRKEIREELIPIYTVYHDKGFQVISYSIDASGAAWKNAIVKDGSKWVQASHLTGDSSPLMTQLRITTIPANYVLDADGKIVAKNLHGQELRQFIESRMK